MRSFLGTFLTVLIVVSVALAFTNPGPDDFQRFAEEQLEEKIIAELGDEPLGRALAGAGSRFVGPLIREATERENLILFSRYTLNLGGSESSGQRWVFIGAGTYFIEWQRPEGLRQDSN